MPFGNWGSIRIGIGVVLLAMLVIHPSVAEVTPILLAEKTTNITGAWQASEDSQILFSIPDFSGFQQVNISYNISEKGQWAPGACGLFFPITTEEYYQQYRAGSPIVYQLLTNEKMFGKGVVTFDPRRFGSDVWMKGRYRLLPFFQPANCFNEATIQVFLLRESGVGPAVTTVGTTATVMDRALPPPGTVSAPITFPTGSAEMTVPTTRSAGASPSPTTSPLGIGAGVIAVIAGLMLIAGKRRRI